MHQEEDPSSGRLTICQHLICGECLPAYEEELDNNQEDGRAQCPVCGLWGNRKTFVVCAKPNTQDQAAVVNKVFPTKLLALLKNVKRQNVDDKW
jgi:SWI/SNF-related matrix-associated actin-dependent regulator of chromatin subfamily A3